MATELLFRAVFSALWLIFFANVTSTSTHGNSESNLYELDRIMKAFSVDLEFSNYYQGWHERFISKQTHPLVPEMFPIE